MVWNLDNYAEKSVKIIVGKGIWANLTLGTNISELYVLCKSYELIIIANLNSSNDDYESSEKFF